jgi:hypothetical protein
LLQIDRGICLVAIKPVAAVTIIGILPQQYFCVRRKGPRPNQIVVELEQIVAASDPPSGNPGAVKFDRRSNGRGNRTPGIVIALGTVNAW